MIQSLAGVAMIATMVLLIWLKILPDPVRAVGAILLGTFGILLYFGGCHRLCKARGFGRATAPAIVIFCAVGTPISVLLLGIWSVFVVPCLLLIAFLLPLIVSFTEPPEVDFHLRR